MLFRSRQIGAEVAQGSLDFGVLTFQPGEPGLGSIVLGQDELVMLVHPSDPLAKAGEVTLAEMLHFTLYHDLHLHHLRGVQTALKPQALEIP